MAAEEMGCDVDLIYDAGAAGIHRLFPDLSKLIERCVDAIVVAAGRGGTLPTVVSGLVPVPVIWLQVSVGALAARASAPIYAPVMFCTCRSSTSMPVLWQVRLQHGLRTLLRKRGDVVGGSDFSLNYQIDIMNSK